MFSNLEILLGFLIALMIGLTGVGGGVLTVPVLVLYLGVPTATAVGTALSFSALVKLPACAVYIQQRKVDGRVLRYLLAGGVPGVIAGSLVLSRLAGKEFEALVLTVVGVTIAVTAAINLARLWGNGGARPAVDRAHRLPWLTVPIGVEVGFSSAGAGALGTLILLQFTVLGAAQVVGTDLVFGLVLSALGGGLHIGLGSWDPVLFAKLVAGGLPGALAGARLATVLPARLLRSVLLVWLVYLGAQLLDRGLRALALLPA